MKQASHLLGPLLLLIAYNAQAQNVGIGTTTPVNKLHVVDSGINVNAVYGIRTALTGRAAAIFGEINSQADSATALTGRINSLNPGIGSAAVRGINSGNNGNGAGIFGQARNGTGVHGVAITGDGVYGTAILGTGGHFVSGAFATALRTEGPIRFQGIGEGNSKMLSSDAAGFARWRTATELGVPTGSGIPNRVVKWTGTGTTMGNSNITDSAHRIDMNREVHLARELFVQRETRLSDKLYVESSNDAYVASFINNRPGGDGNGISIQVNDNTPDKNNNFIVFRNESGVNVGRIEGRTLDEWHDDFDFIFNTTVFSLEEALILAWGIVCAVQQDWGEVGVAATEGASKIAFYTTWEVTQEGYYDDEGGVAYESGGGDYAEWLEKLNPNEKFSYGDIVGVVGGKISKDLTHASHFMVISKAPIVLGKMPEAGKEELYEKVAFMGQVPIKIRGTANVGDYIIASKMNDGFGIAVNPKDVTLDEIPRIAGVAWSASKGGAGFSYVNGAIGINVNDVAPKVKQIETENETLKATVNGLIAYLKEKDPSFKLPALTTNPALITKEVKPATDTKAFVAAMQSPNQVKMKNMLDILEKNPEIIESVQSHARATLDKKGVKYQLFEQTNRLITDSKYLISYLKEAANVK